MYNVVVVKQYVVVILVNLTMLSVGMNLAWTSPVLVKLSNANETVLPEPITEYEGSWIASIGSICGVFANFVAAYLVDRIGRKYCIIMGNLPRIATGITLIFARDVSTILACRAVNGLCDCILLGIVSVYASEIASKDVRGTLGSVLQVVCSLGVVAMLSAGPFLSFVSLHIFITVVAVLTSVPLFFLPDSPFFLYSKGKTEEARKVLVMLRGSESLAQAQMAEYAIELKEKADHKQLFRNKVFLKSVGIVTVIGFGAQLTGYNAIAMYLQTIFETAQTNVSPQISSVIIGLIQLLASFVTLSIMDKFGRKPIIAINMVVMTLGMLGLGIFFKIKETSDSIEGLLNYLPLASLILVVFSYSAGIGSVVWTLLAELFDGPTRGTGVGIGMFMTTMAIFLTAKYFAYFIQLLGPAVLYWIFSVNCVLLCLFIIFCVPETKGKTFAEIQSALGGEELQDDKQKA